MASLGTPPGLIRFGPFALDPTNRELRKRGHVLRLRPQALAVLLLLTERAGQIVSREEIHQHIWGNDTFVDFERGINFSINQIRAALGDDADKPRYVETIPRRGYRFIAAIENNDQRPAEASASENHVVADRTSTASSDHDQRSSLPDANPAVAASPASVRPSSSHWALRVKALIGGGLLLLLAATSFLWWRKYYRPSHPAEIKERQLTNSSSDNPIYGAAISGDGKYLAFDDNFGLHVRSLESGEIRNIPNPAQFGDTRVFWSIHWFPDSTRFFAVSYALGLGRTITWEASVMGGTLHKFRDDAEAWAVSPDGLSVAATKADGLWVMDTEGGNARRILDAGERTDLGSVQWSPDGTKLLYIKWNEHGAAIEFRDVKSGANHVLLSDPNLRNLFWLRDGRVLYVRADSSSVWAGETCNYWIARFDERTNVFASRPVQLTHNRGLCIGATSATADSSRLVFTKRSWESGVYIADVEAGGTRITPPRHLNLTEDAEQPNGWTADGREVVFESNRDENWGIYREPLDGGPAKPVLVEKKANEFGFPRPTPDGGWLLIERASPGTPPFTHHDLLRVPMTGGPEELIAKDIYRFPTCAAPPIRLCVYSKKEKNELVFMGFDPQLKPRELGRFAMDPNDKGRFDFALSPDATRIAIYAYGTGNFYLLNLKMHALQHIIVKHWNNLVSMDWTADGKGLFMSSDQGDLLHVDLQGNAQVVWERRGQFQVYAVPSPDGRHLAMPFYSANSNVWMMENF